MSEKKILKKLIKGTLEGSLLWRYLVKGHTISGFEAKIGKTTVTLSTDLEVRTGPYAIKIATPEGVVIISSGKGLKKLAELLQSDPHPDQMKDIFKL